MWLQLGVLGDSTEVYQKDSYDTERYDTVRKKTTIYSLYLFIICLLSSPCHTYLPQIQSSAAADVLNSAITEALE